MKKLISRIAFCAGLCAVCVAGTAIMSFADTTTDETAEQEGRERPQDDGSVSAKIVSLSGSTLTVYLEERQEPPADGTAPAEGETPPEKPEGESDSTDGTTPPEPPADGTAPEDGTTPPEKPEGDGTGTDGTTPPEGGMGGHGGMGASFSEETTALTVSSSTTVTEGMEKTSASLSDLEADDIVRLVLDEDGTTVVSIEIMNMTPPESDGESSES